MAGKILIADDSNVFRQLEARVLESRGFEVLHATNGIEALKMALNEQPDLILLDVQMPEMDGVQVLTALKQQDKTKEIPVIVITTIGREKDREILLRGGADAFLSKPIQTPVLVRTINELLES